MKLSLLLSFIVLATGLCGQKVELEIFTEMPGVEVFLDSTYLGSTDESERQLFIKPKLHRKDTLTHFLRLRKEGFEEKEIELNGPFDEVIRLSWAMQPERFRLEVPQEIRLETYDVVVDHELSDTLTTGRHSMLIWGQIENFSPSHFDQVLSEEFSISGYNYPSYIEGDIHELGIEEEDFPDMMVGANVRFEDVKFKSHYSYSSAFKAFRDVEVRAVVEFRIWCRNSGSEILKREYSGTGKCRMGCSIYEGMLRSFADATIMFLRDPEVHLELGLCNASPEKSFSETIDKVEIEDTPNGLEKAMKSTVTIITGSGHGSGFFVNEHMVITNNHVIDNEDEIKIKLSNGDELDCELHKSSWLADIAVLRVDSAVGTGIPMTTEYDVPLASDVWAIGTPRFEDLGQSISKGIVSGKRELGRSRFIQTDCSVSPGNSGGPLLDIQGSVIGVVAAKLVSKSTEGVAFAIPITDALESVGIEIEEID